MHAVEVVISIFLLAAMLFGFLAGIYLMLAVVVLLVTLYEVYLPRFTFNPFWLWDKIADWGESKKKARENMNRGGWV